MKCIRYENDWECDRYYVGKQEVGTLTKVKINCVEYNVIAREVSVQYSDHGHVCHGRSIHYFVKAKVFGIMTEFDLNTIIKKKPITVLKWTPKE